MELFIKAEMLKIVIHSVLATLQTIHIRLFGYFILTCTNFIAILSLYQCDGNLRLELW